MRGPAKFAVLGLRQEGTTTLVSNLGNAATGSLPVQPNQGYATSFTTDAGPLQYTLSTLHLRVRKHSATAAAPNPSVTVYRDDGGQPGPLLYTLIDPSGFLSADDILVRQYTFTAPEGATLDPDATYWVVFHSDSGNYIVESTSETTETGEGWMIGDESLVKLGTLVGAGNWESTVRGPAKFAVLGLRQEGTTTLVSNLGNAATGSLPVQPNQGYATSFTIDAAPLQYTLSTLHLRVRKHSATAAAPNPSVTVHRDDGGQPGALLYTLIDPSGFLSADDILVRQYTFTAPEGATLDPDATYWVVFHSDSGNYIVESTSETTETGEGWMIGDESLVKLGTLVGAGNWESTVRGPAKFAVLGSASALEEGPSEDLPGGANDCHLTDKVVVAGHTSSGHLTAGVDTSSGLTGDCFRLETQWGKQYRVEVKFGDTESVHIGGSAWIVYTGSDFSGMSSLGSAVDHNREDGRTFTDFKHNNSTVKSYFVDVAAYDLYSAPYSTNSLTYNGPYTITLTDITGVAMMVSNLDQETIGVTALEFPLTSGTDTATEIDLGIAFTVGAHPSGYRLDRVRVPFNYIAEAGASPAIAIYSNSSDTPNTKVCDIAVPTTIVKSALTWGDNPPPHEFLAPDCANNILAASTQYWIVFSNLDHVDYDLGITASTDERQGNIHDNQGDRASGWEIGYSTAVRRDSGSWANTASRIFRAEFWAKER